MITNIIATIIVSVVTNTVTPIQYWNAGIISHDPGYWSDDPRPFAGIIQQAQRPNPDVKIIVVHKIKTLSFEVDGQPVSVTLSNDIIDRKKFVRKVETKEEWKEEEK